MAKRNRKQPKPKIGLYCRVSTSDGKQKTASQRLVIKSWLKQHRHRTDDYRWFEDKSSGKNLDRPAMESKESKGTLPFY